MQGRTTMVAATLAITTSTSFAATLHVPADHATIQGAIDAAFFFGDTIQVAAGTYYEFEVDLKGKSLQLIGETHPDGSPAVKIDAQQQGMVMYCISNEQFTTGIKNIILTGGSDFAGGLWTSEAQPLFTNCWFLENSGDYGGGAYINGSSPTFQDCRFLDNEGCGVYVESDASPSFTNCIISGNGTNADYGGGIYAIESSVTCTQCTLDDNTCGIHGGGIYLDESSIAMTNCTMNNNTSGYDGGGLWMHGSSGTVSNCTINGNSTKGYGGGVYLLSTQLALTDCVIKDNVAGIAGGGMYSSDNENVQLENCSICGNTPEQMKSDYITISTCLTSSTCEGDVNGDDAVDISDLLLVIGNWSSCP